MSDQANASFPLAEMRGIVHDLFQPNPRFYWADLLITLTIAYGCAGVYFLSPLFSPQQIICLFVSGFALHRLANYIHEIAHLHSKRSLQSFQVAWDVLVGIPTLMPSYFFHTYMSHHNTNHFGTRSDCEYVPLGRDPLRNIGFFMCQIFLQPLFVVFRHTVVTPISFLHPTLRQWVLENFSTRQAAGSLQPAAELAGHSKTAVRPAAPRTAFLNSGSAEPTQEMAGEWAVGDWNRETPPS